MLVLKKINGGLDTWTKLGTNLMATRDRLDELVGRVDGVVADVQAGKGTVGQLLTDSATADELKTLLVKASHSVDEFQVTLNNLRQASTNLPAISDAIRLEAKDLPGLYRKRRPRCARWSGWWKPCKRPGSCANT